MRKESFVSTEKVIIASLIVLVVYLYYQNNQKPLPIQPQKLQDLQQQVQHYQTLYQKRVEKDVSGNQEVKISQLQTELAEQKQILADYETEQKEWTALQETLTTNLDQALQRQELYQQKVSDLETQLLNLAKQKVKGKKEAQELLGKLENNWKDKESEWEKDKNNWTSEMAKSRETIANLEKDKKGQQEQITNLFSNNDKLGKEKDSLVLEKNGLNKQLAEAKEEISQKEQTIIGLNNSYSKLEKKTKRDLEKIETKNQQIKELEQEKNKIIQELQTNLNNAWNDNQKIKEQAEKTQIEQLRKINVIFDENAQYYETIDFEGLYKLLEGVKEGRGEPERILELEAYQKSEKETKTNIINKLDSFLENLE